MMTQLKGGILATCTVLVLAAAAQANSLQELGGRWKWWENTEIQKALDLTDQQISRIRQMVRARRERMIDLRGIMAKKALLLEDEVERADFDMDTARAAAAEFQKARAELARVRLELLLEIRGVLSKGQFLKLREMRRAHKMRRSSPRRLRMQAGEIPPPPKE